MTEKTYPATLGTFTEANGYIEEQLDMAGASMKVSMQIQMAFEEIFVNIASYAYPDGCGNVTIGHESGNGIFTLRFTDTGIPFNPLEREDPDVKSKAEDRSIGGLGIFMVKKTMDTVDYEYRDGCNILTLTKRIN